MNTAAARGSSTVGLALHAAHPQPAPSAEVRGLSVAYGRQVVLDRLDWQLHPGQVVGLLGRNGAGKTTLLESLLGLREPQAGSVRLFDTDVQSLADSERARIGYVPQQSDLFEWLTPTQLLRYFRSFYPRWNEAKVKALLSRWEIERDKPIGKLSGGQKQRLSIVRALAHDPDLLVFDEPVASLDPAGRRDFLRELVEQVIERGTTVVFSTHILSDLERVAFNVAFLAGGRIALHAPLDALIESCLRVVGAATEVESWCTRHGWQLLASSRLPNARMRALARGQGDVEGHPTPGLSIERVTLEDLFMELTR